MKRVASALFLIATVVLLYRKTTRLWWTYDDAWLLHRALARPWTEAFASGDVWHRHFTPLLDTTFELLVTLTGVGPDEWYRLQLILIAACAVALYAALRQFRSTVPSVAGALLFAAGAPLCTFATQLMLVHCLEAVLLGIIATIAFVAASRRRSNALNILSAFLYFVSMLANAVAIALPLLLLVLPERDVRVRARHLVLHLVAAVAYFTWRWAAIGTVFGRLGWTVVPSEVPGLVLSLPWKIIRAWSGATPEVGLVAVAIMSAGAVYAMRGRRALVAALVGLALSVGPILLASGEIDARMAVAPWLWLCVLFAIGASAMGSAPRQAMLVAAVAAVLVANRQQWTAEYARAKRMSDEGRAFMTLDGGALLRRPIIPPAAMTELQWLKEGYYQLARGTGWFYDDSFLCSSPIEGKRIFEWTPGRRQVVEVTARIPDFAKAWCASLRDRAPLRAEFHHRGETLFWQFGPYDDGRWTVVMAGGVQAFEVPREEGFRLTGVPGLSLRVRYDSPEGWVTYSPDIVLDFARQPDYVWHR